MEIVRDATTSSEESCPIVLKFQDVKLCAIEEHQRGTGVFMEYRHWENQD